MNRPPLLIEISRAIREVGELWHIEKTEAGTLFRATVNRQQVWILSQLPGTPPPDRAADRAATLHIVSTLPALVDFLRSFQSVSTEITAPATTQNTMQP